MVAFDWNDLPVSREFDCKFLKNVKSPPHALPPPPPTGFTLIGALQRVLTILESRDQNLSNKHGISHPPKRWVAQTLASTLLI